MEMTTRLSAAERREDILEAAVVVFAAHGFEGASTEDIAKAAGISQPYLFRLFGTKKELFIAVVRRCFERTRLAFEDAAKGFVPGGNPLCDSVLDAIGQSYMELLADRTVLLLQLQAYAACSDPDVRGVVREEFGRLHRRVAELSGASGLELHHFFAEGMLLNIAAAVEFEGKPKPWLLEQLEGGV